ISAAPLSDVLRGRLMRIGERLTGQRVRLEEQVRPEVLGGVSLRIGDRVIDFTLRSLLSAMVERLASAPLCSARSGQ
ncbi:MAG: F0F1 ATP synthase subunit delta, partial [Armatimonadetes bacterium]|nr:F0F1 ATP synthase subunit delta [Armatimonadota bacterium]